MRDILKLWLGMFLGVFGVIFIVILGMSYINIHFVENVPVTVYVDGKKVYSGPSAGIDVDSFGANTTVSISGGFLYWFPKEYYVSHDVKLVGKKD